MENLHRKKIATPGKLTTAHLLLQLYFSSLNDQPSDLVSMPFHEIMDAVANGNVHAGLIIHESRFTYPSYGLTSIVDLGDWWENQTGLPIPLGSIIARRNLGNELIATVDSAIRKSVHYAFIHRDEPMQYIKKHSQELSDEIIKQHINLYVNDFSLDLGETGTKAVNELLARAEEAGIIPQYRGPHFYD
jgi:1,4-dihydroxy-6-naphthoate synthase